METKICKCGKEFEVVNFSWQCDDCKKAATELYIAQRNAEKKVVEKCYDCGTTENLTVHFGMNEQTGKYSTHCCTNCNAKHEAERKAEREANERKQEIYNAIAETDN